MKLKPLNNHLLVEVIDEYAGLARPDNDSESLQSGIVRDFYLTQNHLTMSTGFFISDLDKITKLVDSLLGKTVYWQEHADIGQRFPDPEPKSKKVFALIPFWRLIAFEEESSANQSALAASVNNKRERITL